MKKKFLRSLAVTLAIAVGIPSIPVVPSGTSATAAAAEIVTINPSIEYQTMEGWGTSIAWWGNMIGGWDGTDPATLEDDGVTEKRDTISELLFSQDDGIGLNIIRYNIGGGDNPEHTHMARAEGNMPGFLANENGEYNWDADANQVWAMEKAIAIREREKGDNETSDIITEFFSNSPPYWMTESGCSTGNVKASNNNLKEEYYDVFADYLSTVTNHFIDKGIKVDYLVPLNEPATSYWGAESEKQEGCHFDPGTSQAKLYEALYQAMSNKGLLSTVNMSGLDETDVWNAISSYNKLADNENLSSAALDAFTKYSTHTYGGNDKERVQLRDLMASTGKTLWMSEVCGSSGDHVHENVESSLTLSNGILSDLKVMKASAWVFWQAVESELECRLWNGNWGLIHAVYEKEPHPTYHNFYGNVDSIMDGIEQYDYFMTNQYYALGQYSKFIKQGYTIIDSGDGDVLAALSPDKETMVIVATNNKSSEQEMSYFLAGVENLNSKVEVYRTSDTEQLTQLNNLSIVNDRFINATLAPRSITTYVVKSSGSMYNKGTSQIINDGVVGDGLNQFEYDGWWGTDNGKAGAYSNDAHYTVLDDDNERNEERSAALKFNGTQVQVYGIGGPDKGIVDYEVYDSNGTVVASGSMDAYRAKAERCILADSGILKSGEYRIVLVITNRKNESSSGYYLDVDYAKVSNGEVDLIDTPILSSTRTWNESVMVTFEQVEGATDYKIVYGTSPGQYKYETDTVTGTSYLVTDLKNRTRYYFAVKATKGDKTLYSNELSEVPKIQNNTGTVYYVDAGTPLTSDLKTGEAFGYNNSSLDQPYSTDTLTGYNWGYNPEESNGRTWARQDGDRYGTQVHGQDGKGFNYTFDISPGKYLVTLGFMEIWNGRTFNVVINGSQMEEIVLTKDDQNKEIVKSYNVTVADDELTIFFQRVKDNPMVSWIQIQKEYVAPEEVTLDKETLIITEGEREQLTATISPTDATNHEIEWSSSDETIATVDENGVVSALKEGSTTIRVITEDGGKTASCDVTVLPIYVERVELNKNTLTITEGSSSILTATISPANAKNQKVEWSSDNESIATVNENGVVSALKAGSTTIRATSEDGGKTDSCVVTVTQRNTSSGDSGSSTSQEPITETITIPGNDGKITVPVNVDKNTGEVTINLNDTTTNKLILEAKTETKENSLPTVILDLSKVEQAQSAILNTTIAKTFVDAETAVSIKLPAGNVTLAPEAIATLAAAGSDGSKPITIELANVPMKELTGKQAAQVKGNETVVNVDIYVGNQKVNVPVTISIPYKLQKNEVAANVAIWHMDDAGKLTKVEGSYDSKTKLATFTVDHQSIYIVGYEQTTAPKPRVNKNKKTYTGSVTIKLNSTIPGGRVYYSTNGKNPTTNSRYVKNGGTITIKKTTTLKIMSVAKGYENSAVVTKKYTIKSAKSTANKK